MQISSLTWEVSFVMTAVDHEPCLGPALPSRNLTPLETDVTIWALEHAVQNKCYSFAEAQAAKALLTCLKSGDSVVRKPDSLPDAARPPAPQC
jgi:hypothetical protein